MKKTEADTRSLADNLTNKPAKTPGYLRRTPKGMTRKMGRGGRRR